MHSNCSNNIIVFTDEPNFYKLVIEHPLSCKNTVEVPQFRKEEDNKGAEVNA
jgi:hypothetical protein